MQSILLIPKCTAGGGTRERGIGTGDITKSVNALANSIGYVFFSYEALVPASFPNIKYLELDGVDPLLQQTSFDRHTPLAIQRSLEKKCRRALRLFVTQVLQTVPREQRLAKGFWSG